MPNLSLNCSVCEEKFGSKPAWNGHLTQKKHLNLARLKLPTFDKKERSKVLVIYAKLPVGKDDKIVQFLSKNLTTWVTSFVWFEERPRVGFALFDSNAKVKEVMKSLKNKQFRLDSNQLCEAREAWMIPEIEWEEMFPERVNFDDYSESSFDKSSMTNQGLQPNLNPKSPQIKLIEPRFVFTTTSHQPNQDYSKTFTSSSSVPGIEAAEVPFTRPQPATGFQNCLQSIRKLIKIHPEHFNRASTLLIRLQNILTKLKPETGFIYKASMCRHWLLGLQHSPKDKLGNMPLSILIYKWKDSSTNFIDDSIKWSSTELKSLQEECIQIETNQFGGNHHETFLNFKTIQDNRSYKTRMTPDTAAAVTTERYILEKCFDSDRLFILTILNDPIHLVELQVWKLFEYLCTFDPHCRPVVELAYYWAKTNSVAIGQLFGSHRRLPDPSGFNWLIILFFQMERMVPPVKLVLKETHTKLMCQEEDIGFSDDPEFAKNWSSGGGGGSDKDKGFSQEVDPNSEEFAGEVLKLLYKFFAFSTTKLLKKRKGKKNGKVLGWMIINPKKGKLNRKKFQRKEFIIHHPLKDSWRLSASATNAAKALNLMKKTEEKLNNYFHFDKYDGDGDNNDNDSNEWKEKGSGLKLEEMLDLLKVT